MIVPDDQLSLAIGREGQNARLAAKLTGWRVDIVGESEFAERPTRKRASRTRRSSRRPLHGGAVGRTPLPERGPAGLPLLRPADPPGPCPFHDQPGHGVSPLDEGEIALLADGNAADDVIAPIVARAEEEFAAADTAAEPEPSADEVVDEATAEGADPEEAGEIAEEVAEEVGTEAVAGEDSAEDVVAEAEELADAAVEAERPAEGSEAQ